MYNLEITDMMLLFI